MQPFRCRRKPTPNPSVAEPIRDRPFADIGGISSGLKSRERSCPYAFPAAGSGVRVIGGRQFPRAKQQAATQVNLDVASSH